MNERRSFLLVIEESGMVIRDSRLSIRKNVFTDACVCVYFCIALYVNIYNILGM